MGRGRHRAGARLAGREPRGQPAAGRANGEFPADFHGGVMILPLSLTLPHKGGGDRNASPLRGGGRRSAEREPGEGASLPASGLARRLSIVSFVVLLLA